MCVVLHVDAQKRRARVLRAPRFAVRTNNSDGGDLSTRRARHFAGRETARAHLHFDDLVARNSAHDLEIWLPGTTRFVVGVGDTVAERDTFVTVVATTTVDGHVSASRQLRINSIRAISAPSPLR